MGHKLFKITYSFLLVTSICACFATPGERVATGTIGGAAAGAGLGAAVGAQTGDAGVGAAIGAGAGALTGAAYAASVSPDEREFAVENEALMRQQIEMERQNREIEDLQRQRYYDDRLRTLMSERIPSSPTSDGDSFNMDAGAVQ